jgi:23S rRNA (uridine2552-2'-O)-methyltransferase
MSKLSANTRLKHVKVKHAKRRTNSSNKWLARQLNDPFVIQSQKDGYRSRAAYKLLEINEKFKILKKSMKVLDLGAAPGSWSQVISRLGGCKVLAVDLLEMDPIEGVTTMVKDFFEDDAADVIINALGSKVDLVMSDMAANTTGHTATDHIRIMALCEKAFELSLKILKTDGVFIAKIFKGGTEHSLLGLIKKNFSIVKHFKPKASRPESSEEYLVAIGFKNL